MMSVPARVAISSSSSFLVFMQPVSGCQLLGYLLRNLAFGLPPGEGRAVWYGRSSVILEAGDERWDGERGEGGDW